MAFWISKLKLAKQYEGRKGRRPILNYLKANGCEDALPDNAKFTSKPTA
jgi:hypothetical protein